MNKTKYLVVGDLHSRGPAFTPYYDLCVKDGLRLISLGDIVDRGLFPGQLLDQLQDLKDRGLLEAVVCGNHDKKQYAYQIGRQVRMAEDNLETAKFLLQNPRHKEIFMNLIKDSWLMYRLDTHYFVHGAMENHSYDKESIRFLDFFENKIPKKNLDVFLYGYVEHGKKTEYGFPVRDKRWYDRVPNGSTVWKGHDWEYDEVKVFTGSQGGKVVMMDTSGGVSDNISGVILEL